MHLSEILGLPVYDTALARIGRVDDLLVDPGQTVVDRMLVQRDRVLLQVSWSAVDALSPETRKVVLRDGALLQPTPPGSAGDLIPLRRDVLDRQIIDIHGRKVVRVNDILLELVSKRVYLRRVEVGLAGAVRRLLAGLVSPRFVRQLTAGLSERGIPWDYVGLVDPQSAHIRLKVHQQLATMHPADLADILEDLGRVERTAIVSTLDPGTAAQALSEAEPAIQASVVEEIQVEKAADLLEEMQPDEAADILGDVTKERSRAVLEAMEKRDAEDVRELLVFPENSAGGLMTTEFFRAQSSWTVGETLAALQKVDEDLLGDLDEIPVVNGDDKLMGVAPLTRLVRAAGADSIAAHCRRETPGVLPTAPFAEVVERFEKYHLRAMAVVDEFGTLVGMINIEDVFSHIVSRG